MQAYLQQLNPLPSKSQNSQSTVIPYRHTAIRFLALFLLIFVQFTNQYTFNNPQSLQNSIQTELDINQSKFNALYTIIALPNIFLAFCVGLIIDYFGIRRSFVIFSIGLPISQIIVALGGSYANYSLMLTGRFFFGIMCESVIIAQTCYVSSWFMGKQLAMAVGLGISLPELGNAANSYFTPIIYQKTQSLGPPLFTSVGLCFLAMISAFVVTYLDIRADEIDKKNNIKVVTEDNQSLNQQQFKLSDLKSLKSTFWLVAFLTMFGIGQYVPFLDNANQLFQVRFCFSQVTAGKNIMITYIVVGSFVFPLAWLVDKVGFKRYFAILGMIIFVIGHFIILVYPQCVSDDLIVKWSGVSWGLFLIGIGYCFYATCLVSSVPMVVKPSVLGTAFGIVQMLQNFVQFLFPTIAAPIVQRAVNQELGYRHLSLFYFVIGLCGVLLSMFLLFLSDKQKAKIDASSKQKYLKQIPIELIQSDSQKLKKHQNFQTKINYTDNQKVQFTSQSENKQKRKTKKIQLQLFKNSIHQKMQNIQQKNKKQNKQKKRKTNSTKKSEYQENNYDQNQNFASEQDNDNDKDHNKSKKQYSSEQKYEKIQQFLL